MSDLPYPLSKAVDQVRQFGGKVVLPSPYEPHSDAELTDLRTQLDAAKADGERLRLENTDAALLLGDSWQEIVRFASGEMGTETALRVQCTKLAGDVAELTDQLAAAQKTIDELQGREGRLREACEAAAPALKSINGWVDKANPSLSEVQELVGKAIHTLTAALAAPDGGA